MKRKKILFLSPLPPPHYGSALSSEMCLSILQKNKNFLVKHIRLNIAREMSEIGKMSFSKIKTVLKTKKNIIEEIKGFDPDVVYFVPATSGVGLLRDAYYIKHIQKRFNKRLILHLRSRVLEKDWSNFIKRKIITSMLKEKEVIILGERLKIDLHDVVSMEKTIILPNAIHNDVTDSMFKRILIKRKENKTLQLLFLSNMDVSKGWFTVLESCKILKEKKIPFICSFVGAWQSKRDEKRFFNFVKKYGLSKEVHYVGKKVGNEKREILARTDILLFPTEYPLETFGRVIVEGMMYGVPVVANSIATIPEIIEDKKSGFLLKENSPEEIAQFVVTLQASSLRKKVGLAARKRFLEKYEQKKFEEQFIQIFEKN